MKSLALTLLFTLAILNVASLADASLAHNSNRILKKRTPAHFRRQGANDGGGRGNGGPLGVIGAQPGPSVAPQDDTSVSPQISTTPANTPTTTTAVVPPTTTTTRGGGIIGGVVSTLLGPDPATTTTPTISPPAPTSTPPTSTAPSSTTTQTIVQQTSSIPLITPVAPVTAAAPRSTTFSTVTDASAAQESATAPPPSGSTSRFTRNTIIIIVAIAGSIGVVALIWTIIRKWKFSPSSSFEDRMQPIDWQPTQDDGIPQHHGRPTSHGSFGSADYHNQMDGYNRSQHGHQNLVADLPPHDLLSGSQHQVGGGYADMYRGPSPQPPMAEGIQRGASLNRGYTDAYDYNGTGATRGY